ncbi:MAG: GtrA family protein [Proteobacteria bacterium]|nr:GtrA family protein [Pseudomonadota bacterium]MBS0571649.1 GtrA family protein [Pseudomonadota bacterium]
MNAAPAPPGGPGQLLRFLATGVVNTALGYAVYAVLVAASLDPTVALVVSYAAGVLWNFFSHSRFVFGNRGLSRLGAYVLTYLALFAVNWGCLRAALAAGAGPLLAQAALTPVMAILAYLAIGRVLTGRVPALSRPGPR